MMWRRGRTPAVMLFGVMLASCASDFDSAAIRGNVKTESAFDLRLAENYLALAETERAEEDYRDAMIFAERAALAFEGKPPALEAVDARGLPDAVAVAASAVRAEVAQLQAAGSEILAAEAAADAQAAYECWLQEAEEGHQESDINACVAQLDAALAILRANSQAAIFVLLAEDGPDEKPTAIEVVANGGSTVLDAPGQAARVGQGGTPAPVGALAPRQINALFGEALAVTPARPTRYVLYFLTGGSELTPESAALLPDVRNAAATRPAARVDVVGHTDRVGSSALNTRLARGRANAVAALLVEAGLPAGSVRATSFGERDNAIPTADGVPEPRNRRVELLVR